MPLYETCFGFKKNSCHIKIKSLNPNLLTKLYLSSIAAPESIPEILEIILFRAKRKLNYISI